MPKRTVGLACAVGLSAWLGEAALAEVERRGAEFPVNSYATESQQNPSVAVIDNGSFVVVWSSFAQDGAGYGVFGRRFDSAGVPLATEFALNLFTEGSQGSPSVAADDQGRFVVAWASGDGSNTGIFVRRFDAQGEGMGAEFPVNSYTLGTQAFHVIAAEPDGDFAVTWTSFGEDGSDGGIFARRFDSTGAGVGEQFQVNTYALDNQASPDIAINAAGRFAIVWNSTGQDGDSVGVFGRLFDAQGQALEGEFQISNYTPGPQFDPDVGMDATGSFVASWTSSEQDGDFLGVFAQRFDADGVKIGPEFQINVQTLNDQQHSNVDVDGDGDFVIVWQNTHPGGLSVIDVSARRFDASGLPDGEEFRVNSYTTGLQTQAVVSLNAGGDFVVVWESDGQDGSDDGVFAQRFGVPRVFDLDGNGTTDALNDGLLFFRFLFGFRDSTLVDGAVALDCSRCTGVPVANYAAGLLSLGQVSPTGPELQINAYTPTGQVEPSIAVEADGDLVVVWHSGHDASSFGVFGRRFDRAGSPETPELQLNAHVTSSQLLPEVGVGADGDFVVVWESVFQDGTGYGVFGRRFDSAGAPASVEFQINSFTLGYQKRPAIAVEDDGDFVVAWQSYDQDGSEWGVFARRFSATGDALATEFQVNELTAGYQSYASIATNDAGAFVVAWTSFAQDGSLAGVFARRFDSSGAAQGGDIPVNATVANDQGASAVAMAESGAFVVAWHSNLQDGSFNGVFARRFAANGSSLATEFGVTPHTSGAQTFPAVGMSDAGDFVVSWQSLNREPFYGVFARRFDSSGVAQAVELHVNTNIADHQLSPAIDLTSAGDFAVVWQSNLQDGSAQGIFAQSFDGNRLADVDGNGVVEPLTDGMLVLRFLSGFRGDTLVSGAVGAGCTRCTAQAIEIYLAAKV